MAIRCVPSVSGNYFNQSFFGKGQRNCIRMFFTNYYVLPDKGHANLSMNSYTSEELRVSL